ncbi:unnamed protein product [Pleuronectes platessa]|uniref:Uncharacterized protein n=1 Tax=Pleuronectes platessa TaxID=8262 RepID=A0A9N7U654_PLEPL|nr:unnamed protein product [Pleuronectes platessa]
MRTQSGDEDEGEEGVDSEALRVRRTSPVHHPQTPPLLPWRIYFILDSLTPSASPGIAEFGVSPENPQLSVEPAYNGIMNRLSVSSGRQTGQLPCSGSLSLIPQQMGHRVVSNPGLAHTTGDIEVLFALLSCH